MMIKFEDPKKLIEDAYMNGYIRALLLSRYYALRYKQDDPMFASPVPKETDVVDRIMETTCKCCLNAILFEQSWNALDDKLLCKSVAEHDDKFVPEELTTIQ